jgi:hypothetical protein
MEIKTGTRHTKTRESTHTAWGKSKTDLVGEKGAGHRTLAVSPLGAAYATVSEVVGWGRGRRQASCLWVTTLLQMASASHITAAREMRWE